MATFKAEIQNKREDGTYNVRIRVTHNRKVRRISTHLFVTPDDITRGLKIKNIQILEHCERLIQKCRRFCNDLDYSMNAIEIDDLVDRIKTYLKGGDKFRLDFVEYTMEKVKGMKESTGYTYTIAINALKRYIGRDNLDISEITTAFLRDFEKFIEKEPSQRGNNRKTATKEYKTKGGRAVSAYLACIRAIHNLAKSEFNDEDRGIIRIPYSPFKNYKIKPQPQTRKRALPVETIQKIIDLPYREENNGRKWNRYNLAKDCFIISLAFIGMNSADLYDCNPTNGGVISYNRRKTKDRREDKAEIQVKIEYCISSIIEKYRDSGNKKLFSFYRHYADSSNFNRAINKGLKQIGEELNVEDLEFYAARHSWATLARSALVGIDKATVHEALNHVDGQMKVTDIYIDKDWSVIWEANKKVLALFDWTGLELMYLL